MSCVPFLLLLLASFSFGVAAAEERKDVYEGIRREAVRPNGDPEGRALPLASRWTAHNYTPKDVVGPDEKPVYHWTFSPGRVMDDIDAGHHVMPFLDWGYITAKKSLPDLETVMKRIAAAGLPFEIEPGNIEDVMFGTNWNGKINNADRYWHRPMAENPAHIRADVLAKTAAAQAGAAEVASKGWQPGKEILKKGRFVIFAGHGHVYALAEPLVSDAQGAAVLKLAEPLVEPVKEGETVAEVQLKMDFWSAADPAIWEQAGGDFVRETAGLGANAESWKMMKEIYPNPPQVQIVSNNEGGRKVGIGESAVSWHVQSQKLEKEAARQAYVKGYVEKMSAYLRGIRKALPWPEATVKCIAYNGFGVNFEVGRWDGWQGGAIPFKHVDMYPWLAWDGSAPDFYCYDWNYATDEHVGSPHIGAMQAYTMLAPRAEAQVPGYQWQLALWDGGQKKRYSYARWGELPRTRDIGKTATAITASGALKLPIEGAKPGELILEQGDFFSIDGHSDYQPALCTAEFDEVSLPGEASGGIGLFASSADIGSVGLPGKAAFAGGVYTVTGAGLGFDQRSAKPDGFHYLYRPLPEDGTVSARVKAMDNPVAAMRPAATAYVPNTPGADYADPAAAALQKEIDEKQSKVEGTAAAGVMIRASDAPGAPFVMLCQRGTRVFLILRRDKEQRTVFTLVTDKINAATKWLRLERKGDDVVPAYSTDGASWTTVEPVKVKLGKEPLAGLAVTCSNSTPFKLQVYSAAADVRADADGKAVIPVGTLQGGPILINAHFKPIAQGAKVYFHDYMDRYEGLCNAALWLSRPRIIREFGWGDFNGQVVRQWQTLMRAVDRVWNDPVLTRFWRKGTLVVNPDYEAATGAKHPFWELTDLDRAGRVGPWLERWKKQDRFHQLTVPINPPFAKWPQRYEVAFQANPDDEQSLIKVWAFAYELGEAPKREWLLYVQSPREDRKAVEVKVPGFADVSVDVPRTGAFYHLREGHPTPTRVSQ
ncbi:MAG: hypothetical protein WCH77_12865 [Planctomycetota bacterium]